MCIRDRNSIGWDDYFESFWNTNTNANYPPYNIVHVNNVESRLEIALAGFKKKEVKVYTEYGKIFVEGLSLIVCQSYPVIKGILF